MSQITKHCHKCNHPLTFHEKTWEKMEWANGKRFPTRHRGCGGEFLSSVSELVRRAS